MSKRNHNKKNSHSSSSSRSCRPAADSQKRGRWLPSTAATTRITAWMRRVQVFRSRTTRFMLRSMASRICTARVQRLPGVVRRCRTSYNSRPTLKDSNRNSRIRLARSSSSEAPPNATNGRSSRRRRKEVAAGRLTRHNWPGPTKIINPPPSTAPRTLNTT